MKPRSWQVFPSLQGVPIVVQIVLIVMMVVGAIFVVGGVKALVDSQRFVAKAATANGVVVDVAKVVQREQRGSSGHEYYVDVTYFHPVVQFLTAREQVVRFQASEGNSDPSTHRVGDSIRILYDPASPRNARLDTWFSRWGDSMILIVVGFALVVIPAVIYRVLRSLGRVARRAAPQSRTAPSTATRRPNWRRSPRRLARGRRPRPGGGSPPT